MRHCQFKRSRRTGGGVPASSADSRVLLAMSDKRIEGSAAFNLAQELNRAKMLALLDTSTLAPQEHSVPESLVNLRLPQHDDLKQPILEDDKYIFVGPPVDSVPESFDASFTPLPTALTGMPDPLASPAHRRNRSMEMQLSVEELASSLHLGPFEGATAQQSVGVPAWGSKDLQISDAPPLPALAIPTSGREAPEVSNLEQAPLSAGLSLGPYLSAKSPLCFSSSAPAAVSMLVPPPTGLELAPPSSEGALTPFQNRAAQKRALSEMLEGFEFGCGQAPEKKGGFACSNEVPTSDPASAAEILSLTQLHVDEMALSPPHRNETPLQLPCVSGENMGATPEATDAAREAIAINPSEGASSSAAHADVAHRKTDPKRKCQCGHTESPGRQGWRRVYNPCTACGKDVHIRHTACKSCGAPKPDTSRK